MSLIGHTILIGAWYSPIVESVGPRQFFFVLFVIILFPARGLFGLDIVTFNYPPIMGKSALSDHGVLLEIVEAAFRTQDIVLDVNFLPVQRAINRIKQGDAFLMIGLKEYFETANTDNLCFFPLMKVNFIFFYLKEAFPYGFRYTSPEALGATSIGVLRNGVTHIKGKELSLHIDEGTDLYQVFVKLYNRRTTLALAIDLAGLEMINQLYPNERAAFDRDDENPFISLTAYAILNRNYPEFEIYAKLFETGLREIVANGSWERIVARYYYPEPIPRSSILHMEEFLTGPSPIYRSIAGEN